MKKTTLALILFLAAGMASATNGLLTCTAGMVSSGFCSSTAESLLYVSHLRLDPDGTGPQTGWDEIAAAVCRNANYQSTVAHPTIPGQTIPNPQTCNQFAVAQLREWIKAQVRAYRMVLDLDTQPARVQPPPDIGQ